MIYNELPDICKIVLSRKEGKKFRHSTRSSIVWNFGTILNEKISGLSATEPGNYAHNLSYEDKIAIAQSEDGDLMFCNHAGEVYILRHEDMTFEKTGMLIQEWLSEAEVCDPKVEELKKHPFPEKIIARWRPVNSSHPSPDVLAHLPDIEITTHGEWIEYWSWPEDSVNISSAWIDDSDQNKICVLDDCEISTYKYEVSSGNTLILIGPDGTDRTLYQQI